MSNQSHPDDRHEIENLHSRFMSRFDQVNDNLIAFQDAAYAMGRARGLLDAERQVGELREQLAQLVSAVRSINRSPAHEVHGVNDEACYWQRKEWIDWVLGLCDQAASLNPTSTKGKDHD